MPSVGKKKFPYTKAGKEEAAMYAKKTGMKKTDKKKPGVKGYMCGGKVKK